MTAGHNALCRQRDNDHVSRQLKLDLPLNEPIRLTGVQAVLGEHGAVDLAIGTAELPAEWPRTYVLTQERLPMVGEEIIALGFPDVPSRHVSLVMHVGRIESVMRGYRDARYLTVSFTSGPALSGAPLVDANGYCVGVMIENTFLKPEEDAPHRPYGQAIAIGHWRDLQGVPKRITTA